MKGSEVLAQLQNALEKKSNELVQIALKEENTSHDI